MSDAPVIPNLDKAAAVRSDGWENLLTGVNDYNRDKARRATVVSTSMSLEEAHGMYKGDDMAARIVDEPADAMTRKFFKVKIEAEKKGEQDKEAEPKADAVDSELKGDKLAKALDAQLDELNAQTKFNDALKKQRWGGGAGILIGVNDGATLERLKDPVNEAGIRSVDYLNVFDARELVVVEYYNNPVDKKFGEPKIYRLNPSMFGVASTLGTIDIHESRILRFSGPVSRRRDLLFRDGWGESIYTRIAHVLRDFGLSWASVPALLQDFAQAVFKIRGLHDALLADREKLIVDRLKIMDMSRSTLRAIMLDSEGEDFERKPTPISGLDQVLDRICNRLAAAARMPVSMLMGQAPAGLNATGEADVRFYYDMIAGLQTSDMSEQAKTLVRYLLLAKGGPAKGVEPKVWLLDWLPLWQLDDVQKSDVRLKTAQADQLWLASGVITPDESAGHFEGESFCVDIQLDKDAREAFKNPAPVEGFDPRAGVDPEDRTAAPGAVPALPAGGTRPGVPSTPAIPGGAPGAAGGVTAAADTALNGAQVTAAIEIVKSVANKELPRDTGIQMIIEFFNVAPDRAARIMGSVGNGFTPAPPEPEVVVAPPNGKPSTKPPGSGGKAE